MKSLIGSKTKKENITLLSYLKMFLISFFIILEMVAKYLGTKHMPCKIVKFESSARVKTGEANQKNEFYNKIIVGI